MPKTWLYKADLSICYNRGRNLSGNFWSGILLHLSARGDTGESSDSTYLWQMPSIGKKLKLIVWSIGYRCQEDFEQCFVNKQMVFVDFGTWMHILWCFWQVLFNLRLDKGGRWLKGRCFLSGEGGSSEV